MPRASAARADLPVEEGAHADLAPAVGHQPVAEVEEAVEVVGAGHEQDRPEPDRGADRRVRDGGRGEAGKAARDVAREGVEVRPARERLELGRPAERQDRAELEEGADGLDHPSTCSE